MSSSKRHVDYSEDIVAKRRREGTESAHFSRACRVCLTEVPRYLSVFTPCGHAVCRACALKLRLDAVEEHHVVICPCCRGDGRLVLMKEELIEEHQSGSGDANPLLTSNHEDKATKELAASHATYLGAVRVAATLATQSLALHRDLLALITDQKDAIRARISHEEKKFVVEHYRSAECSHVRAQRHAAAAECTAAAAAMTVEEAARIEANADERYDAAQEVATRADVLSKAATLNYEQFEREKDHEKTRVEELIDGFKKENEESAGLRFSRVCRACDLNNPLLRSFFPSCGHAVCRPCADKAQANEVQCPVCHKNGHSINLYEETANLVAQ